MATNTSFINGTIGDVQQLLDLIEAAQAKAAARMQEWNALVSGGMVLEESDFEGRNYTLAQFADVQTALNAMPTLLGGWATVFYRIKE